MSEGEQSEREKIGTIELSDNYDLVVSMVVNKKCELGLEDKVDNKKLELSIKMKEGLLCKLAEKWCNFCRSAVVYGIVVVVLMFMNFFACWKWEVRWGWWLLPTAILGVGLLVQGLDAYLSVWQSKCVCRAYKRLKDKTK